MQKKTWFLTALYRKETRKTIVFQTNKEARSRHPTLHVFENNNSVYHRFSSFCMHFIPLDKFIIISVVQIRYLDDVLSHRAVELLTELLDCTQGFGRTLGDFVLFLSIPNFLYWSKILQSIWNISKFWYLKPVHFHLLYL